MNMKEIENYASAGWIWMDTYSNALARWKTAATEAAAAASRVNELNAFTGTTADERRKAKELDPASFEKAMNSKAQAQAAKDAAQIDADAAIYDMSIAKRGVDLNIAIIRALAG